MATKSVPLLQDLQQSSWFRGTWTVGWQAGHGRRKWAHYNG
jgi:hypothetical protein